VSATRATAARPGRPARDTGSGTLVPRLSLAPVLATRARLRLRIAEVVQERPRVHAGALDAALGWLGLAHETTGGAGVSGGFSLLSGWEPASDEAAAAAVQALLCAAAGGARDALPRACRLGDLSIEAGRRDAALLRAWLELHEATGDRGYLDAAARAADDAVRSGGGTPDADVSASLLRLGRLLDDESFVSTARGRLEATLSMQGENAWLGRAPAPRSSREIAQTLGGLVTAYEESGDERLLEATLRACETLIRKLEVNRRLAGAYDAAWKPVGDECLAGTAQLGALWFRVYELTGDPRFLNAGLKAVDHAASRQARLRWPPVHGALPGADPIDVRRGFPTVATAALVVALVRRSSALPE
jgi:uncharacterized protein YyaL (SSP411 family)